MSQRYLEIARRFKVEVSVRAGCPHWPRTEDADALWNQVAIWDPAPRICTCCEGPVLLARDVTSDDTLCVVCRFSGEAGGGHLVQAILYAGGRLR